jgi:hypothetical protein
LNHVLVASQISIELLPQTHSPPAGIRDIATVAIRAPRLAENTNRTQKTEKNYADVAACKFFARHPKSI